MAADSVLVSKQPSLTAPQQSIFSSSALPDSKASTVVKAETLFDRSALRDEARPMSESDNSSDEIGELVIDLDNDDSEKQQKSAKRSLTADDLPRSSAEDIVNTVISSSPKQPHIATDPVDAADKANAAPGEGDPASSAAQDPEHIRSGQPDKSARAKPRKSNKMAKGNAKDRTELFCDAAEKSPPALQQSADSKMQLPTIGVALDSGHGKKARVSKSSKNHKKQSRDGKADGTSKAKVKTKHASKNAIHSKSSAHKTAPYTHFNSSGEASGSSGPDIGSSAASPRPTASLIFSASGGLTPKKGRTPSRTALISSGPDFNPTSNKTKVNCYDSEQHGRKRHKRRQIASKNANGRHTRSEVVDSNDKKDGKSTMNSNVPEDAPSKKPKTIQEGSGRLSPSSNNSSADNGYHDATYSKNSSHTYIGQNEPSIPGKDLVKPGVSACISSSTISSALTKHSYTSNAIAAPGPLSSSELNFRGSSEAWSRTKNDQKSGLTPMRQTVGTMTSTSDIGVMTEPDFLGPCEPGTSVHLDGIVWQETDTGVLVVNVTWRNRTYVGTLLDATKHDWAPPRLSDTDADVEYRGRMGRSQRLRGGVSDNTRKSRPRATLQYALDDVKRSPSSNKRKNKATESDNGNDLCSNLRSYGKRTRLAPSRGNKDSSQPTNSNATGTSSSSSCSSPDLECPHPNCNKRYRDNDGLKYHQVHAHEDAIGRDADEKGGNPSSNPATKDVKPPSSQKPPVTRESNSTSAEKILSKPTESTNSSAKEVQRTPSPAAEEKLSKVTRDSAAHSSTEVRARVKEEEQGRDRTPFVKSSSASQANVNTTSASASHASNPSQRSNEQQFLQLGSATLPSTGVETSSTDYESAQAVQTLLQIQDSGDGALPGLSVPYRRDIPNSTYTVQSSSAHRGLQVPSHHTQPSSSTRQSGTPKLYPSGAHTAKSISTDLSAPKVAISSNNQSSISPKSSFPLSSSSNMGKSLSYSELASTYYRAPNLGSGFVSHASKSNSPTPGLRMAKGKTVPVPMDPGHSLPSTYAGAAKMHGPGDFTMRKDDFDAKSIGRSKAKQNFDSAVAAAQSEAKQRPPPALIVPASFPANSAALGSNPSALHGSQIMHSMEDRRASFPAYQVQAKHDPDSLLPLQAYGSKKVAGIISPAANPSNSQSGNNVTVKGTFHPHKSHPNMSSQEKPQVPSSSANSSNLNNNNKLPRSQQSHGKNANGKSVSTGNGVTPTNPRLSNQNHAKHTSSQSKPNYLGATIGLGVQDMIMFRNKVESAIADEYSLDLANRRNSSPSEVARAHKHDRAGKKGKDEAATPKANSNERKPGEAREIQNQAKMTSTDESRQGILPANSPLPPSVHRTSTLPGSWYNQAIDTTSARPKFEPNAKEQYEMMQERQQLLHQQLLSRQQAQLLEERRSQFIGSEKGNSVHTTKSNFKGQSVQEKHHEWQQPAPKRPQTASPFSHNPSNSKESQPRTAHDVISNTRYKSPQPRPQASASARCQSTLSSPTAASFRTKSDSITGGRTAVKHSDHAAPKPTSSPLHPEKIEEVTRRQGSSPNRKQGPIQYYHPPLPIFDFRGMSPYAVASIPPGYIFPAGAAAAMYPTPGVWPPVVGRQSPIAKTSKERTPPVLKSPVKDEKPKVKVENKFPTKDRSAEVISPNVRKVTPSPEVKTENPVSAIKKGRSSPVSANHRSSSPPTQMHHHTHHHIHGVYQPSYPYPATPAVLAGTEAAAYTIPYQKRE